MWGLVKVFEKVVSGVWSLKSIVMLSVWSGRDEGWPNVWLIKKVDRVWSLKSKVVPGVGSRREEVVVGVGGRLGFRIIC